MATLSDEDNEQPRSTRTDERETDRQTDRQSVTDTQIKTLAHQASIARR